jgi:phenylacetate-CoA ligase
MPLLRYQNGDYVTIDDTQCSCRRSLRLISKLEGRNYEFLLTTSNERISSGICDVILGNVGSVGEFQVRQDALDHIRILLVPCRSVGDDEKDFIRRSFRHYLGETAEIEIQIVDEIPRTRAQKLRTAINEMLENSVD